MSGNVGTFTAKDLLRTMEQIRRAPYRVCHHIVPPRMRLAEPDEVEGVRLVWCAALCGQGFLMVPEEPVPEGSVASIVAPDGGSG